MDHLSLFIYTGIPLGNPDFVSQWYTISLQDAGKSRLDIDHDLGEMPIYVHVQVKSINSPNEGFIFPALGLVPRDDDIDTPHSGIVYLYNEKSVIISAPTKNNDHAGSVILTEDSMYWKGPNSQDDMSALVRVRAWKASSFPKPDFNSSGNPIGSKCQSDVSRVCFYEIQHGLQEYPSFVVVRTKLTDPAKTFNGYMSDAVGAAHSISNSSSDNSGYVIYGFDNETFRVWSCSSTNYYLFTDDGYEFKEYFDTGLLEILAWNSTSLSTQYELTVPFGRNNFSEVHQNFYLYYEFPDEFEYCISSNDGTDEILVLIWVESLDGANQGFRFVGTGGMSYFVNNPASPCSYGGLVYGYTNDTIRLWTPGADVNGKLICIPDKFASGKYSQASNNGRVVIKIWTVSTTTGPRSACTDNIAVTTPEMETEQVSTSASTDDIAITTKYPDSEQESTLLRTEPTSTDDMVDKTKPDFQQEPHNYLVPIICSVMTFIVLLLIGVVLFVRFVYRPRKSVSNVTSHQGDTPQHKFSSRNIKFGLHDQ